jgi:hypothetical protein
MILDTDPVTFGTQNLSFGRPGAPLWQPGGPGPDPGAPGSRRKETLESRLGFLSILGGFRDLFLRAFWEPWSTRGFPVQLCAHLLGCYEQQCPKCMQDVVSQPQRCHFRGPVLACFLYFFQKKNECEESVGSQVVCSALFRGSRDRLTFHPLQPAQSNRSFSCSGSP